jgi:hypothetical protein
MDYKIALKVDGKWVNVGSFKKNKWDGMTLGLHVKPELAKLILETETGKWVNLSAFPDDGEKKKPKQVESGDDF